MLEENLFARKDSKTGKGMNEGFYFEGADKYFESEEDALALAKEMGYKSLKASYKAGEHYWTTWKELDNDAAYDADGRTYFRSGEEWVLIQQPTQTIFTGWENRGSC
jgi:hypothetical protein